MSDNQEKGFVSLEGVLSGLFPPEMLPKRSAESKEKTSKPSAKLQKAAAEIAAQPDRAEAAYLARELVQCTLPHRDPGNVALWVRRNGNFALGLQPGSDLKTGTTIGLPYGSIPRLILLWIVTEAIRTKNRRIKLGDTLNDFLREIGLDPNTGRGKRGDATRLKDQLMRLLRCRISFEYNESKRQSWRDMLVADEGDFWWDHQAPDQATIFESQIELGEKFYKAITAAPVPVDLRALIPLKQSPLAIDVYTWATYRLHTMQRAGSQQIKIPLSDLKEQFGSEYNRANNFKAAFVEALIKVQEVFPALDYSFEKSALILRDSRQKPAIAPTDKTAAQRRLSELKPFDQVSDKAREKFKQDFPRWDADVVIADFHTWREEKGQHSANTDAHFKAFARSWVERNK
jgi:hypothetical protein